MQTSLPAPTRPSPQAIFDQVATHLVTQQFKSSFIRDGEEYFCYRNEQGHTSPIGCLLTEDQYFDGINTIWPKALLGAYQERGLTPPPWLDVTTAPLLLDLENVHDDCLCHISEPSVCREYGVALAARQMLAVAKSHGIQVPAAIREIASQYAARKKLVNDHYASQPVF